MADKDIPMAWKKWLGCVILTAALTSGGCEERSSSGQGGRVAVVDLDQLARGLGRSEVIQRRLEAEQRGIAARLQGLQQDLQRGLNAESAKIGPMPSRDQLGRIEGLKREAEQRYGQAAAEADKYYQQVRHDLLDQFRKEVGPPARRIAATKGLTVVLIRTEALLEIDPECEITNEVMEDMKRSGSLSESASPPGLTPDIVPTGPRLPTTLPVISPPPATQSAPTTKP